MNIGVLSFFLLTKPDRSGHHINHPPNQKPRTDIMDILQLDAKQESTMHRFADYHNEEMKDIQKKQHDLITSYFQSVANDSISEENERTILQIQKLEKEKIEITQQHLLDVKSLLNEDQLIHFKEFVRAVSNLILSKEKKNPRPPKDFN